MVSYFQIRPPPDIHTEYSQSQVPLCEDYLYYDQDYPIETYASRWSRFWRGWFLQNRPWDLMEWFVRITPKCRQFPIIFIIWSPQLIPPISLNNFRTAIQPDPTYIMVSFSLPPKWHFGTVLSWKSKFLSKNKTGEEALVVDECVPAGFWQFEKIEGR